jgi:hypothetical protein
VQPARFWHEMLWKTAGCTRSTFYQGKKRAHPVRSWYFKASS